MMTITVQFTGICTHHAKLGSPNHRVILVRADHGANLNGASIPPHIPKLRIKPKDIVSIDGYPYGLQSMGEPGLWQLCGVRLSLEGTTGNAVKRDPKFQDLIPHLEMPSEPIPTISNEVTAKEQAACYFDIDRGRVSAFREKHGAITSFLKVSTTAAPSLRVTCFWNQAESVIHLRNGAKIGVEHTGYQHGDSEKDFLLHYRIFTWVHADAKIPPKSKKAIKEIPGDISIGCSNSQYP